MALKFKKKWIFVARSRYHQDISEKFRRPENVQVQQFLALAGYFRRYASISKPLTMLTKNNFPFAWNESQKNVFQEIKSRLVLRPILALYNSSANGEVHTDASLMGLSGILFQINSDGHIKPVSYFRVFCALADKWRKLKNFTTVMN